LSFPLVFLFPAARKIPVWNFGFWHFQNDFASGQVSRELLVSPLVLVLVLVFVLVLVLVLPLFFSPYISLCFFVWSSLWSLLLASSMAESFPFCLFLFLCLLFVVGSVASQ
jgi:polyferredoxin